MEMDSYKSRILDGVLVGSGTKTKSYKPVSQIAFVSVSIFCAKRTHCRVPGLRPVLSQIYFGTIRAPLGARAYP